EGAYLAVLLPAPNPRYLDYPSTRPRMRVLLNNMVAEGWFNPAEADSTWHYRLVPRGWEATFDDNGNLLSARLVDPSARIIPERNVRLARYFVFEVQRYLRAKIGSDRLHPQGGFSIITTLELRMHTAAERATAGGRDPANDKMAKEGLEQSPADVLHRAGDRTRPAGGLT
ncbi:hypothetical protein HKBW3S42_02512, partial [Candidatus Hakubella thermalkaliphila]